MAKEKAKKEEPTMETVSADENGNVYLEGMEQVVCKEVNTMVKKIETKLKPAFGTARDALTQGKRDLEEYVKENKEKICAYDEENNRWVYEAGGVFIEITEELEEKVTFSMKKEKK